MTSQRQQVVVATARARAVERLTRPAYSTAAVVGATTGVLLALGRIIDQSLPGLIPEPPLTLPGAVLGILLEVVVGGLVGVVAAAFARGARRALFKLRFRDPAG